MEKFVQELKKMDQGLASYGEKEVRNNLQIGAVDTLLLSEDLKSKRVTLECTCGYTEELTQKEGQKLDEKVCPNCNEKLRVATEEDLVENLAEIAEQLSSTVEVISTETDEGMQLFRGFGGVAAILRYRVK